MQKFENINNHRENQRNQNNQRGQGKNYQKPSRKPKTKETKTFRPMSAKVDMGLKVLFFLFFLVFPMVFDSCCLDLFGCFGFFGFPDGF